MEIFLFLGPTNDSGFIQKPPTPQQHQHNQQQPASVGGGTSTPTTTGQQSQQLASGAPNQTTANNSHSACTGPSSNHSSPHPSPLYPGMPSANQLNGNTQGMRNQLSIHFYQTKKKKRKKNFLKIFFFFSLLFFLFYHSRDMTLIVTLISDYKMQ